MQFVPAVPDFVEQLRERYPYREEGKFLIFDLREPEEAAYFGRQSLPSGISRSSNGGS
jgi:hypothetical protein